MLDIPALRQLCEAATTIWLDPCDGTYEDFPVQGGGEYVALPAAARTALPAALDEIESLRAELAAAREKKPVAWAIFNDRMSWPVVGCDEAEIRGKATMTGDRVVPLIIPPGAGG